MTDKTVPSAGTYSDPDLDGIPALMIPRLLQRIKQLEADQAALVVRIAVLERLLHII